jgi:hypothetical protein
VIEEDGPVRDPERVVVRQREHAGAELDVLRLRGDMGDEDLGRGDELRAARMVFADPCLVVAELVEQLDRGDIAGQRRRRVLAGR